MATPQERHRLGQQLLKLRTVKHGWTLVQVQELTGIDKGNLSRIERGERGASLATLRKLRDAYMVDDDVFIAWVDAA